MRESLRINKQKTYHNNETHDEVSDGIAHEAQVDTLAESSPLAHNTRQHDQVSEHVKWNNRRKQDTQRAELVIARELVHKALEREFDYFILSARWSVRPALVAVKRWSVLALMQGILVRWGSRRRRIQNTLFIGHCWTFSFLFCLIQNSIVWNFICWFVCMWTF